jgi:hypothetical protein
LISTAALVSKRMTVPSERRTGNAVRTAEHLDAHDTTRAGIIRDVEIGLHLDHGLMPSRSNRPRLTTDQNLVL